MTGKIHSFQSFGTVDGPGVRAVVFMQGCPLKCGCCHNPDTRGFDGGTETSVNALTDKILRCRAYFGENGGVTVSGGEPLMQADFVYELFSALKAEGIHTTLDTSGCILGESAKKLLTVTDLVLLDYKYTDKDDYLKYTGMEIEKADEFLDYLNEKHIPTWIRQVIIPTKNDSRLNAVKLREVVKAHPCVKKTELLPFRKLCLEKYENMGVPFPFKDLPEPGADLMNELEQIVR